MATLCLHNWLMNQPGTSGRYQDDCPPIPYTGLIEDLTTQSHTNTNAKDAQDMRDEICDFFNGVGAVYWQKDKI